MSVFDKQLSQIPVPDNIFFALRNHRRNEDDKIENIKIEILRALPFEATIIESKYDFDHMVNDSIPVFFVKD